MVSQRSILLGEKRIRKIKKFDDDFVQFDSKPKLVKKETYSPHEEQTEINDDQIDDKELTESPANEIEPLYVEQTLTDTGELKYNTGDLVWARIGGHPWWPCMISNMPPPSNLTEIDADTQNTSYIKYVGVVRPKRMFYVLFFGPSIEHAWVNDSCMIDYKGIV